jgi:tetratricopeptide (TPR) repeat protein
VSGYYLLGAALLHLNHVEEAEQAARRALLLKPDYAPAYLLLADVHPLRKENAALLSDLDAYLRLAPNGSMSDRVRQVREALRHALTTPEEASASARIKP